MAVSLPLEDELHACIATILRKDFPFTQTSIINTAAKTATHQAVYQVKHLKQAAAKSGVRPVDFFDLPRELRDQIYAYTVTSPAEIQVDVHHRHRKQTWQWHPLYITARQPAITRVSRQVREETLKLFYHLNTFTLAVMPHWNTQFNTETANAWLQAIGPKNARHIRKFIVRYTMVHGNAPLSLRDVTRLRNEEGLALVRHVMEFARLV